MSGSAGCRGAPGTAETGNCSRPTAARGISGARRGRRAAPPQCLPAVPWERAARSSQRHIPCAAAAPGAAGAGRRAAARRREPSSAGWTGLRAGGRCSRRREQLTVTAACHVPQVRDWHGLVSGLELLFFLSSTTHL